MKRFEYFEKKIVNNIKMKDKMKEEIKFIKVLNQKLLEQSYLKKNDLEKEFQSLNDVLLFSQLLLLKSFFLFFQPLEEL